MNKVDWEGLKSLKLTADQAITSGGKHWATEGFTTTLYEAFPAILAEHERDQRVIEAAREMQEVLTVIAEYCQNEIDFNTMQLVVGALAEYDKAKQS